MTHFYPISDQEINELFENNEITKSILKRYEKRFEQIEEGHYLRNKINYKKFDELNSQIKRCNERINELEDKLKKLENEESDDKCDTNDAITNHKYIISTMLF